MQNNNSSTYEDYLSTTIIAKRHGIIDSKKFIDYLVEISLLTKDENGRLLLSDKAKEIGGIYKTAESGTWIVWPKNALKSYLEEFVQKFNIQLNYKQIEPVISQDTLTAHQLEIFNKITNMVEKRVKSVLKSNDIEDYIISLRGPAGTGKTFLTAQLAKYFKAKKEDEFDFVITSPTHKATGVISQMLYKYNINAICKTVHSFLGIKPFRDFEKGVESFKIDKTKKQKDTTSILFVDESSMIGSELFEYIMEALETNRVKFVIFIGDPYQLLPVNDNENTIYELKNQFELKEVVRQAEDSYVLKVATELRKRLESKSFIPLNELFAKYNHEQIQFFHNQEDFINDFYKNEEWYKEDKIIATHKNQSVDSFNKIIRAKFWEQKKAYNPATLLRGDMIRFKEAYSPNETILYHNGQVIELQSAILKHHDSLDIMYWECRAVDEPEQQIFRVVEPDSLYTYNEKLKTIAQKAKRAYYPDNTKLWKTFYAVRDMFADVQYIHASTIHKLQGSTHDTSYVDIFTLIDNPNMSIDEKYRLTYVAVTRARYNIKVFISKFDTQERFITDSNSKINTKEKFDDIDLMLKNIYL